MARKSWVYVDGVAYERGVDDEKLYQARQSQGVATVLPDLPDFVSPIDGKTYSGRAGLRDHCARHNVVPTADLAGLPPRPLVVPRVPTRSETEARKRHIAEIVNHYMR